jgi:hypothetical protein
VPRDTCGNLIQIAARDQSASVLAIVYSNVVLI